MLPRIAASSSRVSGNFVAFVILLILAITKTNANSNTNDNNITYNNIISSNNNNMADALSDKSQVPSWPAASSAPPPLATLMMTSEIVISANTAAAPSSNFNKNTLQQERHKHEQQHFSADNNKRLRGQNAAAAAATAGIAAAKGNNVNGAAIASTDDARNGFHDKINISNQRNEFNGRPETTTTAAAATFAAEAAVVAAAAAVATSSSSATTTTAALKRQVAASSFLERVELQESFDAALSPAKRRQLLLHRQKRYLVFPEGSSFQLVFDLIIPIVDYTNFAIMGITCAIAWELPSKPPSEIIENFRDKLNDGTFGLSRRRNDTTEHIKYVNGGGDDGDGDEKGSQSVGAQTKVPATVATGDVSQFTSAAGNFENANRKPTQTDAFYKKYDKDFHNPFTSQAQAHHPAATASNAYYAPWRPQKYFEAGGGFSDFSMLPTDKSSGGWKTFDSPPHTKAYSKYYANNNNNRNDGSDKNSNGGTSGYADKQKYAFADWQSDGAPKWRSGASQTSYVARNKYYQQQPWMHEKYTPADAGNAGGGGGWGKDNWWQRNKQRVQQSWRDKQHEWRAPYVNDLPQTTAAATPIYTSSRTGRNRKILTAPPKHHIYPVFGKRRRRRSGHSDGSDDFDGKLERLHLREQLQSRQKLYGKIEQLYSVRGHNGTACVLRALCETGQRRQHTKPQSFLKELLRAVFILPEEEDEKVYGGHGVPQYRASHAAAENCVQRFAECEHSFWNELE